MVLQTTKKDKALLVSVSGHLDANWSDYFTDTFLEYIRCGEHQIVIDALEMSFLSSAGIRSLVRISKELTKVKGHLRIIQANDFVISTLQTTGFGVWLSEAKPEDLLPIEEDGKTKPETHENLYVNNKSSGVSLKQISAWKPWDVVHQDQIKQVSFQSDSFALGIGSPYSETADAASKFGDFSSVCGNIVYQSPGERSRPDYLLTKENYVPQMQTIQCLYAQGEMSHLLRFKPDENNETHRIGELAEQALAITNSDLAVFVILAEIDGLVGAYMIQSPDREQFFKSKNFTELREWLSFSGERAYTGEQALIFGVATSQNQHKNHNLLVKLSSKPTISAHVHAIIFPYQPLQNGKLDLKRQMDKFFNGPPPKGLMHLIEDNRPTMGLGESSFTRGAMWCAPAQWKEDEV
jgi:anti-anti-sigma factor